MLSEHENKLLCEVDAGKPMGDLLRRFWMPVALAEEVPEPDCDPIAVKILGEELVVFRDTDGRPGVVSAYCAHRHANLFWGRNEEHGLRCTYHGWKYDVDGRCVDTPNEPPDSVFREKISIAAYPAREAGGCIWAYLGPPDKQPADLPQFEWVRVPESHRIITKRLQLSSWAQAVEGGIDSSHISFLHSRVDNQPRMASNGTMVSSASGQLVAESDVALDSVAGLEAVTLGATDRSPRFWVSPRDFGFMVAARRNTPDEKYYWRLTPFLLPASTIIPGGDEPGRNLSGHFWVPVDDEHCWTFSVTWNTERPLTQEEHSTHGEGFGIHTLVQRDVSMWDLGISHAYLPMRHRGVNYQLDRRDQRTQTFTGIKGISEQDMSIQESMGATSPRWFEHLGTTDKAVVTARLLLLKAIATVEAGDDPPGVGDSYHGIRAIEHVLEPGVAWRDALLPEAYPNGARVSAGV